MNYPSNQTKVMKSKFFTVNAFVPVLFTSLCVHLLLLLFFDVAELSNLSFMLFFSTDTLLWALCLTPWKTRKNEFIALYDPIIIFVFTILLCICTIYLSLLIDPSELFGKISYGSNVFTGLSLEESVLYLAKSELVILVFVSIMIKVNNNVIRLRDDYSFKRHEFRSALIVATILYSLSIVCFMLIWSPSSYIYSIINLNTRGVDAIVESSGKLFILQEIGILSLTLGLIGWFSLFSHSKYLSLKSSLLVFSIVSIIIIQNLPFGSRADILFTVVVIYCMLSAFRFRIKRRYTYFFLTLIFLLIFFITIYRYQSYDIYSLKNLFSVSKITDIKSEYLSAKSGNLGPLVDLDRVGPIAMIIRQLENYEYTYGQTLFARPLNLIALVFSRFTDTSSTKKEYFKEANTIISERRGLATTSRWAVPPSIPGQFYMELGTISLLFLSFVFAKLMLAVRMRYYHSTALITKWLSLILAYYLVKSCMSESASLSGLLLFQLPIIYATYVIVNKYMLKRA